MMQRLAQRYVSTVNQACHRTGTLWDGRYKACLIDREPYLLTCMCYIELNPVRAQMVAHPADCTWSSYRHNGAGKTDPAIMHHPLYSEPGDDPSSRCRAYRELFSMHITAELLHDIRNTAEQELVPGTGTFKRQIGKLLNRQTEERPGGRPRNISMRNN